MTNYWTKMMEQAEIAVSFSCTDLIDVDFQVRYDRQYIISVESLHLNLWLVG